MWSLEIPSGSELPSHSRPLSTSCLQSEWSSEQWGWNREGEREFAYGWYDGSREKLSISSFLQRWLWRYITAAMQTVFKDHLNHMTQQFHAYLYTQQKWKHVHTKTCSQMFMAALLIIVKRWKQPECLSTDEWIISSVYPYNGMFLSSTKEILIHAATWVNLENITLS